jgi:hypothetical protein
MGIMDDIQEDVRDILSDGDDFALPVTFTSSEEPKVTVTCNALAFRHSLVVDPNTGLLVNGRNARVTVSELSLKALNYPVRNSNNVVAMKDHVLTWTDVSQQTRSYIVGQQFPDESTGLILLELSVYTAS